MDCTLNYLAEMPLHKQVEIKLLKGLIEGHLSYDKSLPPVAVLCRSFCISVYTAKLVYKHMLRENLICAGNGRYYFCPNVGFSQPYHLDSFWYQQSRFIQR